MANAGYDAREPAIKILGCLGLELLLDIGTPFVWQYSGRRTIASLPMWHAHVPSPMLLPSFPFSVTDWAQVEPTLNPGEHGVATWRTRTFGDIRVRMVDYSPGYVADHWCEKGHVVLCIAGELITDLKDSAAPHTIRSVTLTPGMSYQVADHAEPHRSRSPLGCRLFIVD